MVFEMKMTVVRFVTLIGVLLLIGTLENCYAYNFGTNDWWWNYPNTRKSTTPSTTTTTTTTTTVKPTSTIRSKFISNRRNTARYDAVTTTTSTTTTTLPDYYHIRADTNNDKRRRDAVNSEIIFPSDKNNNSKGKNTPKGIPISAFKKMNAIRNSSELFEELRVPDPVVRTLMSDPSQPGIPVKSTPDMFRSANGAHEMAPTAFCSPQPATVPVEISNEAEDANIIYYPSCVRLDRCSGCCTHELLTCSPKNIQTVTYQVLKLRYNHEMSEFQMESVVNRDFERHVTCECQCRIKESDCNSNQVYRPNECQCECKNQGDAVFCGVNKFWDPTLCACRCREVAPCSSGLIFNNDTCTCNGEDRPGRLQAIPAFRAFD